MTLVIWPDGGMSSLTPLPPSLSSFSPSEFAATKEPIRQMHLHGSSNAFTTQYQVRPEFCEFFTVIELLQNVLGEIDT